MNRPTRVALGLFLMFTALFGALLPARAQANPQPYREVFYSSDGLRIQAYLYVPDGVGPFPAIVYSHGSRDGRERESIPFVFIGRMLARAGCVVLVSERRGYGHSDGPTWREEAGNDPARVVRRLEEEAHDVLAAADYLKSLPIVDPSRMGAMGWSFGGVVTMLATSRSNVFAIAIDQAGGALTWNSNAVMRQALSKAASETTTAVLLQVAKNDRTVLSITTLADILERRGVPHQAILYDAFDPQSGGIPGAPGHAIFSAQGAAIWEADVVGFIDKYLHVSKARSP